MGEWLLRKTQQEERDLRCCSFHNEALANHLSAVVVKMSVNHLHAGSIGGQKKTLNPLELELQMVVNCRVDAGHQIQVFCKNSQCS
ncbi:hypothetical protein STEG23_022982 [Scotinomys teguina]